MIKYFCLWISFIFIVYCEIYSICTTTDQTTQSCYKITGCLTYQGSDSCVIDSHNECSSKTITNAICLTCSTNFQLINSQCIIPYCNTLNENDSESCTSCSSIIGNVLNNNNCTINNCKTQSQYKCTQCETNYSLVQINSSSLYIICSTTIQSCLYYKENNQCSQCNDGYHLNSNNTLCILSNVTNCLTYTDYNCTVCDTSYSLNTDLNLCYANILNCANTIYSNEITYCSTCNSGYYLTSNYLCALNVTNCQLFSSSLTNCLVCKTNYTLTGNQCKNCPISNCVTCSTSTIYGNICSQCATNFVFGSNSLSCIGSCQSKNNSMTNCVLCSNSTCSTCIDGYYTTSGSCASCSSKFANCQTCSISKCSFCQLGYYYDNTKSYCYSCTSYNTGCQYCVNGGTSNTNNIYCQSCQTNYVLTNTQICTQCSNIYDNCATCINNGATFTCLTCQGGYSMIMDKSTNEYYCLKCTDYPISISNCYSCTLNTDGYQCLTCNDGYYFNSNDSLCYSCQSTCATCENSTLCTSCSSNYIYINGTCSTDTTSLSITSNTSSSDVAAYTNLIISKNSLGTYSQMGSLNSKGYFCQSDKQCNMNGQCLLISCKCISNMSGSRCQFQKTTDFSDLQSNVLSYFNSLTTYDSNTIDTLVDLADTTFSITERNLQSFQEAITNFINYSFDSRYFTVIGAIANNIISQETIATQKLTNLDTYLFNSIVKQSNSLTLSQIYSTSGPYHKQIIGKFDLFNADSYSAFTNNFVASYSQCDNEKKFLSPQVFFTSDLVTTLKTLQSDASTPIIFNQMNLYFTTHKSSGQTINSTVTRIQFIKNGTQMSITSITGIIVVPKNDQMFADTNENNICVYWDEDKQIWSTASATLLKCKYYTVCQVNHFSDFGTYIYVAKNTTSSQTSSLADILYIQTEFQFSKAVQNSGFAISMTILGLFIVFSIILTIWYKKVPPKDYKLQKLRKNFWSIYPINAICTSSSLEFSLQKLSLYTLQQQMYVTFTSIYLSSIPFKFGMLTAYYLLAIIQTWICNYLYGGFAIAFRKKKKGKVLGFYWVLWVILFLGTMIIGIWQMYGLQFKFDMYLLVGVIIEFVLDSILCDLFVTYLYQSLFIEQVVGFFKIIKFKGYYES